MKRDEWLFRYTAIDLSKAATLKKAFHQERLSWWEGKKKETMQKIKDSGLEVHDSVAAEYGSVSNRSGYGATIQVDSTMQRDLNECQEKIRTHADLVKKYSGWEQVLNANANTTLEIDHDDYLFFYEK